MIIDDKPKPEEPIVRSAREKLLEEFDKQSDDVMALAYMYAKGYELAGEDVTKAWTNAIRNTQIIETAYRRGYEDCEKDILMKRRRDFFRKVTYDMKKGDPLYGED